jgi:DNA end-binding protein Ku
VPVALFPAARAKRFSLRMLGPKGSPLARRYVDPDSDEPVEQEETIRGYDTGGENIEVTQEELDRLAPDKSRDINLRLFADRNSISPLYFNRPYFLVPAGPSTKAYRLLAETIEKTGRAGIATFVMRGKEYLVVIIAENNILRAQTLRWADEIRPPADIALPEKRTAGKKLVSSYSRIIDKHSAGTLPLDKMHDKRVDALHKLVEKKFAQDRDVMTTSQEETQKAEVLDIFEVLKRSLANTRGERTGSTPSKRNKTTRTATKRASRTRTAA